MAVYVDDVAHPFGNILMCHMWADSEEELLNMADKIGINRIWIQGHPTISFGKHRLASWIHFDIAQSKKKLAIAAGAILTDKYVPALHCQRLRLAQAEINKDEALIEVCTRFIANIERIRERDSK